MKSKIVKIQLIILISTLSYGIKITIESIHCKMEKEILILYVEKIRKEFI